MKKTTYEKFEAEVLFPDSEKVSMDIGWFSKDPGDDDFPDFIFDDEGE